MPKQLGKRSFDLPGLRYCVAFNSRKAARAVTKLYDLELAPPGIRSTQFTVLIALAESQPVSIGELAKTLLIDTTTLHPKPPAHAQARTTNDIRTVDNEATIRDLSQRG